MKHRFQVKRIYDEPHAEDGVRILVDRLWPRGTSKERAQIDSWAKELTPSKELRTWFHQAPSRRDEFAAKYAKELGERSAEIDELLLALDQQVVTLVTATKDLTFGHVAILQRFLEERNELHISSGESFRLPNDSS